MDPLTLVNIGISSAEPPLRSMPTVFLSGPAAAAGIATINSIGNLGGFVGPAMIGWIKDQTGSFVGGLYFVAGLLVVSAIPTLMLALSQREPASSTAVIHHCYAPIQSRRSPHEDVCNRSHSR